MRGLWTSRWILVHAAALILVVAFLALGWWQVQRAAGGNLLSFGYAVEWPAFAAFVIFVWVTEMRRAVRTRRQAAAHASRTNAPADGDTPDADAEIPDADRTRTPVRRPHTGPAYDDSGDADLAAYNRYLAWLNTHPSAAASDYWTTGDPMETAGPPAAKEV
jgi:hypothetical protein